MDWARQNYSDLREADKEAWAGFVSAQARYHSAFYAPAFFSALACVEPSLTIAVGREAGKPQAFVPFEFATPARAALRVASRPGLGLADHVGPILAPGMALSARQILQACDARGFAFDHLDEAHWSEELQPEEREVGLYVSLADGREAFEARLQSEKKKVLNDLRRRRARLEEAHGPLKFVWQEPDRDGALDRLLARKRAQYARTGAQDVFANPKAESLVRTLAKTEDRLCTPVLSGLYAGETWIAGHFGLRCLGSLHYWFPVYCLDHRKHAPGQLLFLEIARAAFEHDVVRIDRGAGDTPAKRDFLPEEQVFGRGLLTRRGPGGLAARALQSLEWRMASLKARRTR